MGIDTRLAFPQRFQSSCSHLQIVFKIAELAWPVLGVNILEVGLEISLLISQELGLARGVVPGRPLGHVQHRPWLVHFLNANLQISLKKKRGSR